MKHLYLLLGISIILAGCKSTTDTIKAPEAVVQPADPMTFASTITSEELKTKLYVYASDEFEGRET